METQNESIFDSSSSFDSSIDQEDNTLSSDAGTNESEQGSDEYAVTPVDDTSSDTVDSSSVAYIIVDNGDIITELQKIQGYDISILYTLYISIGLFLGFILIKIIWYFARG